MARGGRNVKKEVVVVVPGNRGGALTEELASVNEDGDGDGEYTVAVETIGSLIQESEAIFDLTTRDMDG